MALLNTIDTSAARKQLRDWLEGKLPRAENLAISNVEIPQSAGFSMTTILFEAEWRQDGAAQHRHLVARVAPTTPGLFETPDLVREFKVLGTLGAETDIKVPETLWLEEEPEILGGPFIVMERAFGVVPADDPPYVVEGWVLDLEPVKRGRLYENTLEVIRQIQDVDWERLGLDFLCEPQFGAPGIQQQIGQLEQFYEWVHEGERSATIDAAFDWVKRNQPAGEDLVLNWGDPRIGNVIFDPETLAVEAVLDWEMATIASPEMELGWFVFFVRYNSEGIGVELPEGLQTRDELIARYEELTGRKVRHLDYYETLAALRASIFLMRFGRLMIAGGALPAGHMMPFNNPMTQLLAKLAGLPAPEGQSTNFVGNR